MVPVWSRRRNHLPWSRTRSEGGIHLALCKAQLGLVCICAQGAGVNSRVVLCVNTLSVLEK